MPEPTPQEVVNVAAFRRLHAATNSGDIALVEQAIDEVVAPGAIVHAPLATEATGPELLKQIWERLLVAYPDLHITVEDLIAKDDKIVARQSITATHLGAHMGVAATGRPVAYNEMFVLRFVDGQIAESWGVVDMLAQMRQIGAIAA
jgi:predicted ester cyclase